jgi:hypothetical protein
MGFKITVWSLQFWEKHRLRVLGNRVLRRIFRTQRDEVTGGWRELHNIELHKLYLSASYNWNGQVKEDGVVRACSTHGE